MEAFLTETAERLISQIRDLAEAEVAALRTETEAVKAELRAGAPPPREDVPVFFFYVR